MVERFFVGAARIRHERQRVHARGGSERELAAGCEFTTAGGTVSAYMARLTDTGIPWVAQEPAAQSLDACAMPTLTAACASGYDFDGAVDFQWKCNGVNVSNGANGASKDGGTVANLDGDGTVGAQDLDALLAAWGAGDVNADGTTDAQDLAAMLAAWGACG